MNQKLKDSNKNDGDSEGKFLYVGVASRDEYSDNSDNLFYFILILIFMQGQFIQNLIFHY